MGWKSWKILLNPWCLHYRRTDFAGHHARNSYFPFAAELVTIEKTIYDSILFLYTICIFCLLRIKRIFYWGGMEDVVTVCFSCNKFTSYPSHALGSSQWYFYIKVASMKTYYDRVLDNSQTRSTDMSVTFHS